MTKTQQIVKRGQLLGNSSQPATQDIIQWIISWVLTELQKFVSRKGYIPISAIEQLSTKEAELRSAVRARIEPRAKKSFNDAATKILRAISPDLVEDEKWQEYIGEILEYLDRKFFPGLSDIVLYPVGSPRSIADSIHRIVSKRLTGDRDADAKFIADTAIKIFDHFYKDADIASPAFRRRTWGLPAGSVGRVMELMAQSGMLDPKTQDVSYQIKLLEAFVPAVAASLYYRRQTGKPSSIDDGFQLAIEYYNRLAPSERNAQELVKNIVMVANFHQEYLGLVTTPTPGSRPQEEKVKAHFILLTQAAESTSASRIGVLGYAVEKGLVRQNSPAWEAWKDIQRGQAPEFLLGLPDTPESFVLLLTKSGCPRRIAQQLVASLNVGRRYVNEPVSYVVRTLQGEEMRSQMDKIAKNVNYRYKNLSPTQRQLMIEENKENFVKLFGYQSLADFESLHPRIDSERRKAAVQRTLAIITQPPLVTPATGFAGYLQQAAGAFGAASPVLEEIPNFYNTLARFLGYFKPEGTTKDKKSELGEMVMPESSK